jgi:ATP-dependent Lhr-like helicase
MGAVDLVVQVESPPSVASGLQRVGRAGHQVGAVSRGVLFPKFRGDLVQTAVVVERMRAGAIESMRIPANPLDVLAQQVVAMCAMDDWSVDDLEALVRRSAPFGGLSRSVLESVLDMLAGRYPSDEFAELRPRVVWDRVTGTLTGRRGAQRLAVTSGGTIPDRGLYGVFLAGADGAGRRVGELDEEMVYESRVGDVFTLGTTSWRIEDITHDRVLVTPAPGLPGRLPFWKGDTLGRPSELGEAVGRFVREVAALPAAKARERVALAGLDEWATDNLLAYLASRSRRPVTCPATGPSSSSGSVTSSVTGASRCCRPSVRRCTRRGRCASRLACASGSVWTSKPCTAMTASSSGCPTWSSTASPPRPTADPTGWAATEAVSAAADSPS